jgi:hypothetical protein
MAIRKSSISGSGGGSNDFTLSVGVTGNTTYGLDRVYTSGRYTLAFVNSDTTYDIYAIAEDGTYAGYTNGAVLEISANFAEIVVLGAASNETIIFSYEGTLTAPSTAGDVATAGAFVSGVVTSSLPGIDDTTVVNGGNFAANVVVSFIDQSDAETLAKNVVRSSSTQLVVTRPDAFSPDDSPYTVKVVNPGIPVPSGTNAHLLADSVTAGTNPVWQTTGDLLYNIGAASPDITLLATDTEETDIDYSVVSGTLPAGITLVEETGVLSGTFSGSASEGDSNSVTFKAIDTGGNFLNKAFNFIANAAPVWITAGGALSTSPPIGEAYSFQLVASGGSAGGSLSYTLQSGSLNTGLSISTSGLISGTNTDATGVTATFTIRVTDTAALFTDREFTSTATPTPLSVDYLVIGGGGGSATNGGGGGAGGYRSNVSGQPSGRGASSENQLLLVSSTSYSIKVGAGGAGQISSNPPPSAGLESSFASIISNGGGRGGSVSDPNATGGSGGSGGGGTGYGLPSNRPGGAGITGQGFNGGTGYGIPNGLYQGGGGGGGAGANGSNAGYASGAVGGIGVSSSITGTAITRAGGGGGGAYNNVASGGAGGGGNGGSPGGNGGINTGGGGGGGASNGQWIGGTGGSGVVILKYPDSYIAAFSGGVTHDTPDPSPVSGYKITTITATSTTSETVSFAA